MIDVHPRSRESDFSGGQTIEDESCASTGLAPSLDMTDRIPNPVSPPRSFGRVSIEEDKGGMYPVIGPTYQIGDPHLKFVSAKRAIESPSQAPQTSYCW